jgi:bifunctional non-homologous end joining protein LigD
MTTGSADQTVLRSGQRLVNPAEFKGSRLAAFPPALAPMIPTLIAQPFSDPDWVFEPKLDGYRTIAFLREGRVQLLSRRGLDATPSFAAIAGELRDQAQKQLVLDGEIVALDDAGRPSFQHLQNRGNNPQIPVLYYVFDLLYLDDYDLQAVPLEYRKTALEAAVMPSERIRLVEYFQEAGEATYEAAVANGMEGVVAKRRDSAYEAGRRSKKWLKAKITRSEAFIVCGYTKGTGTRADTFGALVLGLRQEDGGLAYAGEVGTGFDFRTLRGIRRRLEALRSDVSPFGESVLKRGSRWSWLRQSGPITWVRPELAAEVKYAERTDDGQLRAPVFLRLLDGAD